MPTPIDGQALEVYIFSHKKAKTKMSTIEQAPDMAPPAEQRTEEKERQWAEAKKLLEEGQPWHALPKKAEALGLKPLAGFTSMAKQRLSKRRDLCDIGHPLSDVHRKNFAGRATASEVPSENPTETQEAIIAAAKRVAGEAPSSARQGAEDLLKQISKKAFELQAQQAFDEVGTYNRHAGWVAARGGNGDLLVAKESDETLKALQEAGYQESAGGYEDPNGLAVPFDNTPDSTKDVDWYPGDGIESVFTLMNS